jgi:hypothetical protein
MSPGRKLNPRLQAGVRDGLPRHGQHLGQVQRGDVAGRVGLGERDAPGGRPGADVEHVTGRMWEPVGDVSGGLVHGCGERANDRGGEHRGTGTAVGGVARAAVPDLVAQPARPREGSDPGGAAR